MALYEVERPLAEEIETGDYVVNHGTVIAKKFTHHGSVVTLSFPGNRDLTTGAEDFVWIFPNGPYGSEYPAF